MKLKLSDVINIIAIVIFLGFGFILINGTTIFNNSDVMGLLPLRSFNSLFTVVFLALGFLFSYNIVFKSYRPSYIFLAVTGFLFITGLIAVLCFKDDSVFHINKAIQPEEGARLIFEGENVDFNYSLSLEMRFRYIIQYLTLLSVSFVIFDMIPKLFKGKDFVALGCLVVLTFASFCIIYSYIKESQTYIALYHDLNEGQLFLHFVTSIYPNKNYYGFLLFVAVVASLYLHQYKGHWPWIISAFAFYLNMLCTWDKSAIILGTGFVLCYFIYRFIITVKHHKIRNIIAISCSVGTIVASAITLAIILKVDTAFKDAVVESFKTRGALTLASRVIIWKMDNIMFRQINLFFGAGYKVFADLVGLFSTNSGIGYVYSAHNGYQELIGTGGILLLTVYAVATGYLIYLSVKYFKKHLSLSLFTMLIITIMLGYMVVESGVYLFSQTLDYGFMSIIVCVPMLGAHEMAKREAKETA